VGDQATASRSEGESAQCALRGRELLSGPFARTASSVAAVSLNQGAHWAARENALHRGIGGRRRRWPAGPPVDRSVGGCQRGIAISRTTTSKPRELDRRWAHSAALCSRSCSTNQLALITRTDDRFQPLARASKAGQ